MKNQLKSGFTLIELLVTIFIVSILIMAFIPFYRKFGKKNDFRMMAQEVKNGILETQTLALAPQNIPSRFSESKPYYYIFERVGLTGTTDYYRIIIAKLNSLKEVITTDPWKPEEVKKIVLRSDYQLPANFDPPGSCLITKLVYEVPSGKLKFINTYTVNNFIYYFCQGHAKLPIVTVNKLEGNKKGRIDIEVNANTGQVTIGDLTLF